MVPFVVEIEQCQFREPKSMRNKGGLFNDRWWRGYVSWAIRRILLPTAHTLSIGCPTMEGAGELSTLATFHTSPPISPPSQLLSSPLHSQRYSASSVPSPARKPGLAQLGNHRQRQVRRIAVRSSSFDFTDVIWDPEALLIRSDDGNCTLIVGPSQRFSFTETQIAQIREFDGRGLSVPHGRDGKI